MSDIENIKLKQLNDFAKKFRELKQSLLDLNLKSHENVRLAIERLDDGYLRAREAIFAVPYNMEDEDKSESKNDTNEGSTLNAVH